MIRDGIQGALFRLTQIHGKVGKRNSGYSAAKFGGVGLAWSLALDAAECGIAPYTR